MGREVETASGGRSASTIQLTSGDALFRYVRLKAALNSSADFIVILDREFRYVDFNDAYADEFAEFMGRRPQIGASILDLLSSKPEHVRLARELWGRSFSGESFSVERSYLLPNGMQPTRQFAFNPIHDPSGAIVGACQIVRDVTARCEAERRLAETNEGLERRVAERTQELQDANSVLRAREKALQSSERRIRELVEQAADAIFVADGGVISDANAAACRLTGYARDELIGLRVRALFRLEDLARLQEEQLLLAETGDSMTAEWTLVRKDGSSIPTEISYKRLPDGRWQSIARDISERRRAEERQRSLIAELDHRVKNTLANILSLVKQAGRQAGTVEEFISAIEARVSAMTRAHELLARQRWGGASLRDVLEVQLAPYRTREGCAVGLDGPEVVLAPGAALALGAAFHELAANAARYGALSVAGGVVQVAWTRVVADKKAPVHLSWVETGGPPVAPPERRGFGCSLIEKGLAYELGGEVELRFEREGLACDVDIPPERLAGGVSSLSDKPLYGKPP